MSSQRPTEWHPCSVSRSTSETIISFVWKTVESPCSHTPSGRPWPTKSTSTAWKGRPCRRRISPQKRPSERTKKVKHKYLDGVLAWFLLLMWCSHRSLRVARRDRQSESGTGPFGAQERWHLFENQTVTGFVPADTDRTRITRLDDTSGQEG